VESPRVDAEGLIELIVTRKFETIHNLKEYSLEEFFDLAEISLVSFINENLIMKQSQEKR